MSSQQKLPRLVYRGAQGQQTIVIQPLPFTIGRSEDRHLSLPHAQVSRSHAMINVDADGLYIEDLQSRHGMLVNGVRSKRAHLHSGDEIQLGTASASMLFLDAGDDTSTRLLMSRISGSTAGSDLEKLSLFLQAAQSFNNTRVLQDVLSTMVEYALRLTGAERGFVFLGKSVATFELGCGRTKDGMAIDDHSKISRSIVRDAAQSGSEFIIGDATGQGKDLGRDSIIAHELRSVIAIPLRRRNSETLLGLLYLDSRLQACNLSSVSRDILHAIATEAATLVENASMLQAEQAAQLMRKEMEIASAIQQRIIAQELPQFPYARLAAKTVQCTEVGGDFYDVIPVKDGFVAIVADVSGKGMSSALLASIIQGMMYAQITSGASLVDTVQSVNAFLCARVSGEKYVTLIVLRYGDGGAVEFVNAGHVLPIVCGPHGATRRIPDGDVPAGLIADATFHAIKFQMEVQERIVLISDGISEAENGAEEEFGAQALMPYLFAAEPITSIFAAVNHFCEGALPHDDRTMLTVERLS